MGVGKSSTIIPILIMRVQAGCIIPLQPTHLVNQAITSIQPLRAFFHRDQLSIAPGTRARVFVTVMDDTTLKQHYLSELRRGSVELSKAVIIMDEPRPLSLLADRIPGRAPIVVASWALGHADTLPGRQLQLPDRCWGRLPGLRGLCVVNGLNTLTEVSQVVFRFGQRA
jgi:hypothetical protein